MFIKWNDDNSREVKVRMLNRNWKGVLRATTKW